MVEIKIDNESLDIPVGFSITIDDYNPIYNDIGSMSVPATVPATRKNRKLLDLPHRVDNGTDPHKAQRECIVVDGAYMRQGTLNLTEASPVSGYTLNVGFDNSKAYIRWNGLKLSELDNLPVYKAKSTNIGSHVLDLLEDLNIMYRRGNAREDEFAVFPVALAKETVSEDNKETVYWEMLNIYGHYGLDMAGKVKRVINGVVTDVTIPEGYGVSPFLKVWRLLEVIFDSLGVHIVDNPFKNDIDLARLVVLNNACDAACIAEIRYADIMPDCTVEEFLNALWVRFGLVYNIDYNTMTVTLRLMRDILNDKQGIDLESLAVAPPTVIYEQPCYVKLSAATSIEGAAPAVERFEDFVKGVDVGTVRLGNNVSEWTNTGTADNPKWDGDIFDDDREEPDPDVPEPDYPEPDVDYMDSRATADNTATGASSFLAREFVTGRWFRLDAANNIVKEASSSFFNWDPQPENHEALELSSCDEWVPVQRVSNIGTGSGNDFNDLCPVYLAGSRHYHSYVKSSDVESKTDAQTPLAFMFAYTTGGRTIGRLYPEGENGRPLKLDDGTTPGLSLLFQFRDGLFARFWATYDEILRHGNRSISVNIRMNKLKLHGLDLLAPVLYNGIRCLVDTASYSLPARRDVPVELKLHTIMTQGEYDIEDEQKIPPFSSSGRRLVYKLQSETFGMDLLNDPEAKRMAVEYFRNMGYHDHGTVGDSWYIGVSSLMPIDVERIQPVWESDSRIPEPAMPGQTLGRYYKARARYHVFEIHDMTLQDGPENIELSPNPIGIAVIEIEYKVVLKAVWVYD